MLNPAGDLPIQNFTDDPKMHLQALRSFAEKCSIPQTSFRFNEVALSTIPVIDAFLQGNRSEDNFLKLRQAFAILSESLGEIVAAIQPFSKAEVFAKGAGWDLRTFLHHGAHFEAVLFGLSPECPEALADPLEDGASWADQLEDNLEMSRLLLLEADQISSLWAKIIDESAL